MKHFDVAAGILLDSADRVLIAERLGDGPFHGLWEFPGGKELGIEVTACSSFMNLRHEYEDRVVTIEFFIVDAWNREPEGCEGQALRWVSKYRLDAEELLPADMPVVHALQQMDS